MTYEEAFAEHKKKIAQILLTHSDLADRKRYLNVSNTVMTLFVSASSRLSTRTIRYHVEELRFGDNDNLGALVANLIEADMFICLTDVGRPL